MILTAAGLLTLLGFVAFIVGYLLDMRGVAVIGGVLVVGVGVMVVSTGLEYRSGETREVVDGTNATNATNVEFQYSAVDLPTRLPLGFMIMLLGSVFVLRGLDPGL